MIITRGRKCDQESWMNRYLIIIILIRNHKAQPHNDHMWPKMNRYLMGPPPPGSLLKVETNQKLQIISGLAFKALKAFQGLQIKCKKR